MSAFGGKADIPNSLPYVCYDPTPTLGRAAGVLLDLQMNRLGCKSAQLPRK